MKTDTQLQNDVMEELKWEPCVTATEIGVSAVKGVVTLNGTVPTYAEKWAAERAAQRVEGVKAIAEEIQIKPIGMHAKTDAEIAAIAAVSCGSGAKCGSTARARSTNRRTAPYWRSSSS